MRKSKLKYGVYRKKSIPAHRVVLLESSDHVWITFNGTNYPAVLIRNFNSTGSVKMAITEFNFRSQYEYVGRYKTIVSTKEEMI